MLLGLLLAKDQFHRGRYQTFQKTFFKKSSSYLVVSRSRKTLWKLKNWKIKKYFGGVCLTQCQYHLPILSHNRKATIACSNKSFDNFIKVLKKMLLKRSLLSKSTGCESTTFFKKSSSQVFFKDFSKYFMNSQTLLVTWFPKFLIFIPF